MDFKKLVKVADSSCVEDSNTTIPSWVKRGLWGVHIDNKNNVKCVVVGDPTKENSVVYGFIHIDDGHIWLRDEPILRPSRNKECAPEFNELKQDYDSWEELFEDLDSCIGRYELANQWLNVNSDAGELFSKNGCSVEIKEGRIHLTDESGDNDKALEVVNKEAFDKYGLEFGISEVGEDGDCTLEFMLDNIDC